MLCLVSGFGKDGNFSCWNLLHFSVNGVGIGSTYSVAGIDQTKQSTILFYSILFFFFKFLSVEYISSRFLGKNIPTWKKALITLKHKAYKQRNKLFARKSIYVRAKRIKLRYGVLQRMRNPNLCLGFPRTSFPGLKNNFDSPSLRTSN